ncbi:molybdopterin-dependent oxidoreductase [Euzebya tangerina]|uniref:molybdopterin-dependent oxidoreductase n=1 Tax=Euzebya tangerina TaxID=591198 RepID=UPI000E320230|nr:molybdopterin-dependent oxidoreductase [Euzebya tangerina]
MSTDENTPSQELPDDVSDDNSDDVEVEGFLHEGTVAERARTLPTAFPLPQTDQDDAAPDSSQTAEPDQADPEAPGSDEPIDHRAARDARLLASRNEGAVRITKAERNRTTRRSLLGAAGIVALAGFGWRSLLRQEEVGNIPAFLRSGFEWNDAVWSTLFDEGGLAPEFALSQATELRVNGTIGLDPELDPASWTLSVEGVAGEQLDEFSIDDVSFDAVAGIPTFDQITEHKCIEGWANITHWTGIRFGDLITSRYEEQAADAAFVSLETPDGEYMVGLDMTSAMHPQTLLASGLEGAALPPEHGAPLRLVTPLHYGIKSLKRIGRIRFANERPQDYWAERGYDWHSTH